MINKALGIALIACLSQTGQAQLPVSRTTGLVSHQLLANTTRFISVPYTREPVVRGVVTAQTGTTVTISGASGLNSLAGTHTLLVANGAQEGRPYTISSFPAANQANATGLPALTLNVDEVLVIPNFTLDTLFPAGGGFKAGANPGAADVVSAIVSGVVRPFYYKTGSGWRAADNPADVADKGSTVLEFRGTIIAKGASTSPGKAVLAGVVPSGDTRFQYNSTTFRSMAFPYGESGTLGSLIPSTKVTTGANPGAADVVYVVVSGVIRPFYYNSTSGFWRAGDNPADAASKNSTVINSGDGVLIKPVGATLRTIDFQQPLS